MLDEIGIGGQRLRMVNTSSAQGAQFAEACEDMTRTVRELGPSPLKRAASQLGSEAAGQQEPENPANETVSGPAA